MASEKWKTQMKFYANFSNYLSVVVAAVTVLALVACSLSFPFLIWCKELKDIQNGSVEKTRCQHVGVKAIPSLWLVPCAHSFAFRSRFFLTTLFSAACMCILSENMATLWQARGSVDLVARVTISPWASCTCEYVGCHYGIHLECKITWEWLDNGRKRPNSAAREKEYAHRQYLAYESGSVVYII